MPNTTEYYISKGFDKATAEYFAGGRKRAINVFPRDDFTVIIKFDNGEERCLDVKPLFKSDAAFQHFLKLQDFQRVYIDSSHCVSWDIDPNCNSERSWNNKVDLDSDWCYMNSQPIE